MVTVALLYIAPLHWLFSCNSLRCHILFNVVSIPTLRKYKVKNIGVDKYQAPNKTHNSDALL